MHNRARYLMSTAERPPFCLVQGRGSWVRSDQGILYLDAIQGRGMNSLGHRPSTVCQAITTQLGKLIHGGSHFHYESTLSLAQMLVTNSDFDQVFFANSGTEAVECAIKLARLWGKERLGGATEIITFKGGYHGRTFGAMAATDKERWSPMFGPLPEGFVRIPYNNPESLKAAISGKTAAVIMELVQGEAGVVCASLDFVNEVRTLCNQHGLLLIFDEIQTGMGRLGTLFGYQRYDVVPDVAIIGKGLGSGLPISAVLAKDHASLFKPGDHGGTFNGGPLVTAAAVATLTRICSEGFFPQVKAKGEYLRNALTDLALSKGFPSPDGHGLMLRLNLGTEDAPKVVLYARDELPRRSTGYWKNRGLLLNAPRTHCLRFLPALTISYREIDILLDGLQRSIVSVTK